LTGSCVAAQQVSHFHQSGWLGIPLREKWSCLTLACPNRV
jgi:hypothetical protein